MNQRDLSQIQHKAGEQSPDDPYEFIMSTETADRMGDIIVQSGWQLKDFRKNPIALFGHDHQKIIGTWAGVRVEGKKLLGKLKMAQRGTSQTVDEVRNLLEQRILKSVSVGFSAKEYESLDPENDPYGWDGLKFTKTALHECSVVAVPANQEALAVAKDMGVRKQTIDMVFRSVSGATTPSRVSDILGDPSDVVRAQAAYRKRHPNAEY